MIHSFYRIYKYVPNSDAHDYLYDVILGVFIWIDYNDNNNNEWGGSFTATCTNHVTEYTVLTQSKN